MKAWAGLACISALLLALPACETSDYGYKVVVGNHPDDGYRGGEVHHKTARRPGPPPHAPAHGYRHKHAQHGVDLVFDKGLGVYVVVGYDNLFYNDGFFFRYSGGHWEMSVGIEDRAHWQVAPSRSVPRGLKAKPGKGGKKGNKGNRGRGNGQGNGR